MFANKIDTDGRPICPMLGCQEPVNPGEGQAHGIAEETARKLLLQGVIEQDARIVIVHKACSQGSGE